MTTTRNTKQKEVILSEIKKLYTHPTAKELHEIIKKKMPQIGFATIYRNLESLKNSGEINEIRSKTNKNQTRYDGQTHSHIHLICKECGKIEDLETEKIKIEFKNSETFQIDRDSIEISGVCKDCITKNN